MTEPTPNPTTVTDQPTVLEPPVPADFAAATTPTDLTKAVKTKMVSIPAKPETVEVMAYVAPDGTQAGNIPALQDFLGPDVLIEPQPSFNVSTGQTCIHVAGQLTTPGDYVVKHADGSIDVLTEDALNAAYTTK